MMSKQERIQKEHSKSEHRAEESQAAELEVTKKVDTKALAHDMDDILAEIDELIANNELTNAALFVQKGGQ